MGEARTITSRRSRESSAGPLTPLSISRVHGGNEYDEYDDNTSAPTTSTAPGRTATVGAQNVLILNERALRRRALGSCEAFSSGAGAFQ